VHVCVREREKIGERERTERKRVYHLLSLLQSKYGRERERDRER